MFVQFVLRRFDSQRFSERGLTGCLNWGLESGCKAGERRVGKQFGGNVWWLPRQLRWRTFCNSNSVRHFCTQFVRCFEGFVRVSVRVHQEMIAPMHRPPGNNSKRPLFLMSNCLEP